MIASARDGQAGPPRPVEDGPAPISNAPRPNGQRPPGRGWTAPPRTSPDGAPGRCRGGYGPPRPPRRPGSDQATRAAPLAIVGEDTGGAGEFGPGRGWTSAGNLEDGPRPRPDPPARIASPARKRGASIQATPVSPRTRLPPRCRPGSPVSNPDRAGPVRVTAPTSSAYAPRARAPPAGAPAISPAQATRPGPARTGGGEFGPGRGWPAPDRADRPGTGRQPASLPGRPAGQRLRSPRPGQDRQSRRRRRPGPAPAAGLPAAPPWPVSGRFRAGERSAGGPRR